MEQKTVFYCEQCKRDFGWVVNLLGEEVWTLHRRMHYRESVRSAVTPFLDYRFIKILGGNVQGDDSPLYERNGARLTIGDFKRLFEVFGLPTDVHDVESE